MSEEQSAPCRWCMMGEYLVQLEPHVRYEEPSPVDGEILSIEELQDRAMAKRCDVPLSLFQGSKGSDTAIRPAPRWLTDPSVIVEKMDLRHRGFWVIIVDDPEQEKPGIMGRVGNQEISILVYPKGWDLSDLPDRLLKAEAKIQASIDKRNQEFTEGRERYEREQAQKQVKAAGAEQ